MKNPLRKRLLPELKEEMGKYLVVCLLMVLTIGFISGFLVADGSMIKAYNEGFEKYNIEDGHFVVETPLNKAQAKRITELGVHIASQFYYDEKLENETTLRLYGNRNEINKVCLMEGEFPEKQGEVAIDRMYADNNHIVVGDEISNTEGTNYIVAGLVALPDYSCLFQDNNDPMFDATKFGVGIVTEETFHTFEEEHLTYQYVWKYEGQPENKLEEHDRSEDLKAAMNEIVDMDSFVPQFENQAITFTGEDMGTDKVMMLVLLYMLMVIMAFVFGITTKNTIVKEANVIGTLRASGYTKGELIRHYMTMPVAVTIVSALIGNILGYTVFKEVCVALYYGSYSLPTYVTIWSTEAFWKTSVIPVLLMIVINYWVLQDKLRLSTLKFLKRDLSTKRRKKTIRLSTRLSFFSRFRIRVILQNRSNYIMVLVGIFFANVLLMFGLSLPAILNDYAANVEAGMFANYQYMLKYPETNEKDNKLEAMVTMLEYADNVETKTKGAEKFSAYSLKSCEKKYRSEEVMVYGVQPDSNYIRLDLPEGTVAVSSSYAEKYKLQIGDRIALKEEYEDTTYEFTIGQIYPYPGSLLVLTSQKQVNELFDLGNDTFVGYFSDEEITDIEDNYISSVIDVNEMTKISRQLMKSMGSMMYMVDGFAIIIFIVLIYLLSKIIIERNSQSISMAKILGYSDQEINRLYTHTTTLVVIAGILLSLPVNYKLMEYLYRLVMASSMNGWISYQIPVKVYVEMIVIGIVTYAIVAVIEYRKVRNVPMDEALKNVE